MQWICMRLLLRLLSFRASLAELKLDYLCAASGANNEQSELLDSLIYRTLVPKESHENLSLQKHQVQKLVVHFS